MSSLREQIITAARTAIQDVAAPDQSGTVPSYRQSSIAHTARFAFIVDWTDEQVIGLGFTHDDCTLSIQIIAAVQMGGDGPSADAGADKPEAAADAMMVSAHSKLMADRTLGGLCMDITASAAAKREQVDDKRILEMGQIYEIKYRRQSIALDGAFQS